MPYKMMAAGGSSGGTETSTGKDTEFSALFEKSMKEFQDGEVVKGKVIGITGNFVMVDIGYKSEGLIPIHEFKDLSGNVNVKAGDEVDVYFETSEDEEGSILLSKEKADQLRIWDKISEAYEKGDMVKGKVLQRIKGGLAVDIGVKAFLPGSQVDLRVIKNLDDIVGKTFDFKILKFNKRRGNVVISRRALLEKERDKQREKIIKEIEEGRVMEGVVKNITEYGAFIDLGGLDGLLHITDMSYGRINHPTELFKVGDKINVKILKFDKEKERVSLGYKQTTRDPWDEADKRYAVGTRVKGKVVSLTDYGAFIELEKGVEGLIHISEMSWTKKIKHPSKVLSIGDSVEAIVLDVDVSNQRISLGLKQLEQNPWDIVEKKYPVGTRLLGLVKNITDFGVFIGLDEGIDGLVRIEDMSWTKRVGHPGELYKKAQEIEAVVLNIDRENERFSLGIKQLTPDPWLEVPRKYMMGQTITGHVTGITDFGVFMEIEKDIEGLIHVTELTEERPEKITDVAQMGQTLSAIIIGINMVERKIALSVKALSRAEDIEALKKLSLKVTSTTVMAEAFERSFRERAASQDKQDKKEKPGESGGPGKKA